MDTFAWSIYQSMWNLGFSDIATDPTVISHLNDLYAPDKLQPFARLANFTQMTSIQKLLRSFESKEIDQLSTDERQQMSGLMFASLDKFSSLSKWFAAAPSLFALSCEASTRNSACSASFLKELHTALQSSSVRELSIFDDASDFRWNSFFEIPSLRTLRFSINPSTKSGLAFAKSSELLSHLIEPMRTTPLPSPLSLPFRNSSLVRIQPVPSPLPSGLKSLAKSFVLLLL
jgi:hypothetical protein